MNVGVTLFLTKIWTERGFAHSSALGVNTYVPVIVLLTVEGFQVPVILFEDKLDKIGAFDPLQICVKSASNIGSIF